MKDAPPAPAAPEPVIRLEGIAKTYRMGDASVAALVDINVTMERGSFWAVMGQSGSGKSTLLNLLGCLDRPTLGRYFLDGTNVAHMPDDDLSDQRLLHLGFVFQSFNLIPQLSVQENIELPMFYRHLDRPECAERARELAEMVGLSDRLHHRPTELSGGQRQRVAIARALANDPAVILADEPTGNLDSRTGEQIMDLLARLNAGGRTVVMVTHEPRIADYARGRLVLRDGRVEAMEERRA